jgi:hypothetical protein
MRISVEHDLGKHRARLKLDGFAQRVVAHALPGSADVRDVTTTWTGDRLDFAFVATKGFFSVPFRGWIDVFDSAAVLDADVPPLVQSFVGEERIRDAVTTELQRLLQEP